MSILSYDEVKKIVQSSINKPFDEWLEFVETFKNPGKQGLVGLLKIKGTDHLIVFKVSQYINYLAQHEGVVMGSLDKIRDFCPHFCGGLGVIKCSINPKNRKYGNPFEKTPDNVEKDVLLSEYLDNKATKLYSHIRSDNTPDSVIYSSIKQTLMAVSMAQRKCKFTHYDLHSLNIMLRKCDKDLVFLYVIDKENQFLIPTRGFYPTIIDFGFSYVDEMNGGPLWPSMAHTDVGFLSDRFDWVADPKLFMVSVSSDLMDLRKNSNSKLFRTITKNIFEPLTIDWDAGWDDIDESGASSYVLELMNSSNLYSKLFKEYDNYCIDIICSLIIMPIEKQNYGSIDTSYTGFLIEFAKIEAEISSNFLNLCILKDIVDSARDVRPFYVDKETREMAITKFKHDIHISISKVAKFCNPKNIHYEKMLCSLYVMARCIEGVFYDVMKNRLAKKQLEYNKLELTSVEQIYGCIETIIPDNYKYNDNTTVFVFDLENEKSDAFSLKEQEKLIKAVNKTDILCRGSILYDFWINKTN